LERRLGAALRATPQPSIVAPPAPVEFARGAMLPDEAGEAVGARAVLMAAPEPAGATLFGDESPWPTEEPVFLAEARERGEAVATVPKPLPPTEAEAEKGPLPPLDELVQRIPSEVREILEELFRVKFTNVQRVPAKHLKP